MRIRIVQVIASSLIFKLGTKLGAVFLKKSIKTHEANWQVGKNVVVMISNSKEFWFWKKKHVTLFLSLNFNTSFYIATCNEMSNYLWYEWDTVSGLPSLWKLLWPAIFFAPIYFFQLPQRAPYRSRRPWLLFTADPLRSLLLLTHNWIQRALQTTGRFSLLEQMTSLACFCCGGVKLILLRNTYTENEWNWPSIHRALAYNIPCSPIECVCVCLAVRRYFNNYTSSGGLSNWNSQSIVMDVAVQLEH